MRLTIKLKLGFNSLHALDSDVRNGSALNLNSNAGDRHDADFIRY